MRTPRALAFLGGVPRQIVPDNLKAGVLQANWHEPGLNPSYQDFATQYGTAILPARQRRPRDKAPFDKLRVRGRGRRAGRRALDRGPSARSALLLAGRVQRAIRTLVDDLNRRPMRRLGVSRRQLFEELDRPALGALSVEPYVYAEWRQRRVALDYHVDVDGHHYSVPHRLLRQRVEAHH